LASGILLSDTSTPGGDRKSLAYANLWSASRLTGHQPRVAAVGSSPRPDGAESVILALMAGMVPYLHMRTLAAHSAVTIVRLM
jgi:hypothetical protein